MKKWFLLSAIASMVMAVGAGCMSSENEILAKLEEKYDQKFSIEGVKEGSKIFDQMYGEDKLTVHPEGNPNIVFLAQEDTDDKKVVNDNYVLAKWAEELKATLADQIEKELPPGTPYKVLLRIAPDKYNASMVNMSFDEYVKEGNKYFRVVLVAGISTEGEPVIEKYNEQIYDLFRLVKSVGGEMYTVSIGFVDQSSNVEDYVRTSFINNISWSNLEAKVYGEVNIDDEFDSENPSKEVNQSLILRSPADVPMHYEVYGE